LAIVRIVDCLRRLWDAALDLSGEQRSMIILFIVSIVCAILWSLFVLFANSMSDSAQGDFRGGGSIVVAWVIVIIFFFAWFSGRAHAADLDLPRDFLRHHAKNLAPLQAAPVPVSITIGKTAINGVCTQRLKEAKLCASH
jgi:hypothetical protein